MNFTRWDARAPKNQRRNRGAVNFFSLKADFFLSGVA